uniref:Uncharacterized protein n=1 Tax=Cacopsylla melanoneura TaxID=428564 RepID=A0A8D8QZB4_9HEMI
MSIIEIEISARSIIGQEISEIKRFWLFVVLTGISSGQFEAVITLGLLTVVVVVVVVVLSAGMTTAALTGTATAGATDLRKQDSMNCLILSDSLRFPFPLRCRP